MQPFFKIKRTILEMMSSTPESIVVKKNEKKITKAQYRNQIGYSTMKKGNIVITNETT